MQTALPKADVGVIVARFQVPELHKAHKNLIDHVLRRHKKVLVLLGVAPVKITRNNPLDFMTRKSMIQHAYPELAILPLKDQASDAVWSKSVDAAIASIFDDQTAVLYGSRDSFIPHYQGRFQTVTLEAQHRISGTEIRLMASEEVRTSKDFRAGIIYAAFNKYPTSYQAVDAAIIEEKLIQVKERRILLGRKLGDGGRWRLFGGFVRPEDASLEEAVKRETAEETSGIATGAPKYLGSFRIQDWRYAEETDKILTALFILPYQFGAARAADDIDETKWFVLSDVKREDLVPGHQVLLDALRRHYKLPQLPAEEVEAPLEGEQ